MSTQGESTPPSRNVGSQTLARGLRALEIVANAPQGASIQDVSAALNVHRSIAYRVLATLADFRLIVRASDGRYRPGVGLTAMAQQVERILPNVAEPYLRELASDLQSTVSLLVAEGDEAVAISVIEPPNARYHLSFRTGSRHPLDRGAAGHALRAAGSPRRGEPEAVAEARRSGYASTYGEVEPGAYGVAAPLNKGDGVPPACINLITYRRDVAERAVPALLATAKRIDEALSCPDLT